MRAATAPSLVTTALLVSATEPNHLNTFPGIQSPAPTPLGWPGQAFGDLGVAWTQGITPWKRA